MLTSLAVASCCFWFSSASSSGDFEGSLQLPSLITTKRKVIRYGILRLKSLFWSLAGQVSKISELESKWSRRNSRLLWHCCICNEVTLFIPAGRFSCKGRQTKVNRYKSAKWTRSPGGVSLENVVQYTSRTMCNIECRRKTHHPSFHSILGTRQEGQEQSHSNNKIQTQSTVCSSERWLQGRSYFYRALFYTLGLWAFFQKAEAETHRADGEAPLTIESVKRCGCVAHRDSALSWNSPIGLPDHFMIWFRDFLFFRGRFPNPDTKEKEKTDSIKER